MPQSRLSLHKHIRRLQDPRLNRRKRHLFGDILTIAVCAVLAGRQYLARRLVLSRPMIATVKGYVMSHMRRWRKGMAVRRSVCTN
jgi:hypothetical protein